MNWRPPEIASWTALQKRAVVKVRQVLKECQLEWRSRPVIRHLSALALCLLVVLVGVLERSTRRVSAGMTMTSPGRPIATQPALSRGGGGGGGGGGGRAGGGRARGGAALPARPRTPAPGDHCGKAADRAES
jgi:hypothetical protein